jgi:hypothetical protein
LKFFFCFALIGFLDIFIHEPFSRFLSKNLQPGDVFEGKDGLNKVVIQPL